MKVLTLKDRYLAVLDDLKEERQDKRNTEWWNMRLDSKIAEYTNICNERGYINGTNTTSGTSLPR